MNRDSSILKKVRRSNLFLLMFGIVSIVGVIVLAAISSVPYWMAQLNEPVEVEAKEILLMTGDERLYNVAVSGEDMEDTYYYEETIDEDTGRQIRIDAYFGALEIFDDQWILVRSPEEINTREDDYVGALQPISGSITREVLELSADELRIDYLPIMLDTTQDETMWYVGTVALVILGLLSIVALIVAIMRTNDPHKHPILKRLSKYGDVDNVASTIESELNSTPDKVSKLTLTRNYLVREGGTFDAMPYESVAWVYKLVRKGRYGIKNYEAHILDVNGHDIKIGAKEEQVNNMLNAVASRAPWCITGFSDDIKRMWNKDRAGFLAEVEKRKRDLKAK